jgi:hypothetical protein
VKLYAKAFVKAASRPTDLSPYDALTPAGHVRQVTFR